jgi:hypothetical protein
MSCFVVPDFHVSALVAWGFHNRALVGISADALAHELATANRFAFAQRYAGRYQDELAPFAGLDLDAGRDLDPIGVVKACDCLAYQASDWAGWEGCAAAVHLAAIRAAALYRVTGGVWQGTDAHRLPGYDAAAWCLDAPEPVRVDLVPGSVADRLAAVLADMSEAEADAIRAALVAETDPAAELARVQRMVGALVGVAA